MSKQNARKCQNKIIGERQVQDTSCTFVESKFRD